MQLFDLICRVVGLASSALNIWDKIHTYYDGKRKDPSGLTADDGSENESLDS